MKRVGRVESAVSNEVSGGREPGLIAATLVIPFHTIYNMTSACVGGGIVSTHTHLRGQEH